MEYEKFINEKVTAPFQNKDIIEELIKQIEYSDSGYSLFGFNNVSKYLTFYLKKHEMKVDYIIDNDKNKRGWDFYGAKIISFEAAEKLIIENIVICSDDYMFDMLLQLRKSEKLKHCKLVHLSRDFDLSKYNLKYIQSRDFARKSGLSISLSDEKLSVLFEFINSVQKLEGSFAEFGCAGGGTALFMRTVMEKLSINKKMYMFDYFDSEVESWWNDFNVVHYGKCVDQIKYNLNKTKNTIIVEGDVLKTLPNYLNEKFCFIHIDIGNIDNQIMGVIYNNLVKGAIVIFDNYCEGACGNKSRTDLFFMNKPEKLVYLPTKQGLLIKQ